MDTSMDDHAKAVNSATLEIIKGLSSEQILQAFLLAEEENFQLRKKVGELESKIGWLMEQDR